MNYVKINMIEDNLYQSVGAVSFICAAKNITKETDSIGNYVDYFIWQETDEFFIDGEGVYTVSNGLRKATGKIVEIYTQAEFEQLELANTAEYTPNAYVPNNSYDMQDFLENYLKPSFQIKELTTYTSQVVEAEKVKLINEYALSSELLEKIYTNLSNDDDNTYESDMEKINFYNVVLGKELGVLSNITYILNDGAFESNPRTQYLENNAFNFILPTPVKDDAVFAGWYDNEALTGTPIAEITSVMTGDKTFYAKWN